jgi:hypothetical protein
MSKHRTSEELRESLFLIIDLVREGKIEAKEANVIVKAAETICKTVELEIEYAKTLEKLENSDSGIAVGRILLTQKKADGPSA